MPGVLRKPLARQPRDLFERAGLFKQMRRAGNDFELLLAPQFRE